MPLRRPHVLFSSHSSVVDVYQDKLHHLAARGEVDLTVVLPERYREGNRIVEASPGDGSYRVVTLPTRFGEQGRQNAFWYRGLASLLRTLEPDVVHLEEEPESIVTLQYVRLLRHLRRRPALIGFTWRNWPIPYPGQPWWHPRSLVQNAVQRRTLPSIDTLITGTHDAEPLFRSLGYRGPMPLIPQYGVDPAVYAPRSDREALRRRFGLKSFTVGYVGRMMTMKGIDDLVDAMDAPELAEAHLLLVGRGPDAARLAERLRSGGHGDRIRAMDGVEARDVPLLMNALDVLCVPSRSTPTWREQFGRVLIEAMACGLPVIGSDSGEIPRVLEDAGIVVAERDPRALARAIAFLMQDEAERRRYAQAGLRRVDEHYTNARLAANIATVYHTTMERSRTV